MGSSSSTLASKCSRFSPPLPLWSLLPPMAPQPTVLPQLTTLPLPTSQLRSCPLSHTPTSTVSLMTTLRLTSRRPRPRMLKARCWIFHHRSSRWPYPDHHLHRRPLQRIRRRGHLRGNPSLPPRARRWIRTPRPCLQARPSLS